MKKLGKVILDNMDKIIYIGLSIMVVNLIFYIFVGSKVIINSDSSFIIDYSIEQIETNSIFPTTWINSNDFWIYSLIPIVTPFIKMGVDFFISRQIAVFVQTVLFFVLLYDFYKRCFNDKKGLIIMLLLFLSGISGQFMSEMYGDATYGTIVIYMLLELCLFIKYIKSNYKKTKYLTFFGIILALLTACSMRFPIYIGAPLICCILYFCYKDGIKKKHVKTFIVLCGSIVVGVLLNALMQSELLYVNNFALSSVVSEKAQFTKNLGKTAFDYFFLCGSTGKSIFSLTLHLDNDLVTNPSSPLIVLQFIKIIYAIITIVIPFKLFKKFKTMKDEEKTLLIYVSSFTFIMAFFLIFGDLARWHRYIFTVVFCLNLLYPMFYKYFFESKKHNRVVFKVGLALVTITSFLFSVNSYINLKETRLRTNGYQYMAEYFEENELYLGYTIQNMESNLFNTLTNGKVKVLRLNDDGDFPEEWLASTRWFNNDYKGKAFFYKLKDYRDVDIQKLAIEEIVMGDFEIYIFENNDVVLDYLFSAKNVEVKDEKK